MNTPATRFLAPRALPAALAALLLGGPALASDTLLVPADFPTIQDAISAAADGDEVLVSDGTYAETIDLLGKAITLRSENGPAVTTIDGSGQALWVVTVADGEGPLTRIEGFTITGGVGKTFFNQQTVTENGGGMRIHGASPTLSDLVFTGNSGTTGGGLQISASSQPLILATAFIGNEGTNGGGLYSTHSKPTLVDVTFEGNLALRGGGIYAQGHELTVQGGVFRDNTGDSLGGAMFLNHVHVQLRGVLAEQNGELVPSGFNSQTYTILGGGGIYASGVSGRIQDSKFIDNTAYIGGGLYLAGNSSTVKVINTLLDGNRAGAWGGGIYFNDCSVPVINSTIVNNFPSGIFTTYASFPTVTNSILAFNGGMHFTNAEIYGNGTTTVSYSLSGSPLLWGAAVGAGVVIETDPQLDADFVPLPGSPAIDAGDNTALPADVTLDLAGNPRFQDDPQTPNTGIGDPPIVDLGAYEFQPPAPAFNEVGARFRR
jgi:predicted outer membrane repeat protein